MGGCKCSFQDCLMTTGFAKKQYPDRDTHFFHFPIRNPERCLKWCIYSNNMSFLELPNDKLKNKVICDFHFHENNFMNFKREKLNKTSAVPTIYITKDQEHIDLTTNPTAWIEENENFSEERKTIETSQIDIEEKSVESDTQEFAASPAKKMKVEVQKFQPVKILNINANRNIKITESSPKKVQKLPTTPLTNYTKVPNYSIRRIPLKTQEKVQEIRKEDIDQIDMIVEMNDDPLIYMEPESLPSKEVVTSQAVEDLKPLILETLNQTSDIKKLLQKKLRESDQQTESKSNKISEDSYISQSHLNKVQLFNGIKRYLSPSMNALLRMELFSTPGREYKNDEKIICSEIYQLGNETYNFLCEEWRLRLPAKEVVEEWLEEKGLQEDNDAS